MKKDIAHDAKEVVHKARTDQLQKDYQLPRSTLMQFPRRSNGFVAAKAHLYRSIDGSKAHPGRDSRF